MKLKQKLAAVLAASMIATAVPVVTYADSTARVTKTVTVTENASITDPTKAPELVISLKDGITTSASIYLELDGATWNKKAMREAQVKVGNVEEEDLANHTFTIKNVQDNILEIAYTKVSPDNHLASDAVLSIPLLTKFTGGEASVYIDGEGTNIRSEKVVFGNAVDSNIAISAGDATTVFDEGTIAEIVVEEAAPGSFKEKDGAIELELTLDHPDFEFTKQQVKATFTKGYKGEKTITVERDAKDKQTLKVTLPKFDKSDEEKIQGKMAFKLSGIEVESTVRTPEEGELNVYVTGDNVESTTLKVANITESDVTVTVDEKAVKEIKGGETGQAKLTLKESKNDGFVDGREVFFTLSNGYIDKFDEDDYEGKDTKEKMEAFEKAVIAKIKASKTNIENVELEMNRNDEVVGFSFTLKDTKKDKVETLELSFPYTVDVNVAGDVSVKVESRMLDKDFEVVVGKVSVPFTVTAETAELLAGKKDQVGGKLTIKEEDNRMIEAGEIKIALEEDDYIRFTNKTPEVNVTAGDLKIGEVEVNRDGELVIEVVRPSRIASTIEISGFNFDVNRMIPNGDYAAYVYVNGNKIEQENFIEIAEEVKEESTIAANGLKKGTAKFVIGSTNFTVNEEAKTMDAAPYVSEKGRTMLPVRYVSEAFGLTENEIIFSSLNGVGTVTIFAGNRTLQLQNNSNVALLNGVQVPMEESVVMKQGRTYVPVGEVGRLLGIEVEWDQATQTATFTNK